MTKNNEENDSNEDWSCSFEQVEEEQLRTMLKLTPTQRLEMAEELLKLAIEVKTIK